LSAGTSRRQAFLSIALACLHHLKGNEAAVLSGTYNTEHIHQMRVAIRRLRSALRLFAPTLPATS
jgi:CHAD domain-containing protein